jgi:hypothetical protein
MGDAKHAAGEEAIDELIKMYVLDLGTSCSAWRKMQREIKKGGDAREPRDLSITQLQARFVQKGGIICDFERPKLVVKEKEQEIYIPDEIEIWRQECRDRAGTLNRISQTDPRGDEWDHFFRQTKFGNPIRTFALPKEGETVDIRIYHGEGAEVHAIGDGRYFPEQQTKMLKGVECMSVMPPPVHSLQQPHVFGQALAISVACSREFQKFAPRGGTQRQARGQYPFKFCTLHLPHSAVNSRDLTVLRTSDVRPTVQSIWAVVDPVHYMSGHCEVVVNTKTTGSFCVAQRQGTDQVFALAGFVSSLGNVLIGKANKFSIAATFNHKRHLDYQVLSQRIQEYEAMQPGKKQYWPGKTAVGHMNHILTEIGGTIRVWPMQACKTILPHRLPLKMTEPQVDNEPPTNSKFQIGRGILVRPTRTGQTELRKGTVASVWQERSGNDKPVCYYDITFEDDSDAEYLVPEHRLIDRTKLVENMHNAMEMTWENITSCALGEISPPSDADPAKECTDPTVGDCRLCCSIVVQTVSNSAEKKLRRRVKQKRGGHTKKGGKQMNWYEYRLQIGVAWDKRLQEDVARQKDRKHKGEKLKERTKERAKSLDVAPRDLQVKLPKRPFPKGLWPKESLRHKLLPRGDSLDSIMDPVQSLLGRR